MRTAGRSARRRRRSAAAALGAALAVLVLPAAGCERGDRGGPPPPAGEAEDADWFEDITERAGLDFVHDAGRAGSYFMPEVIGSGAALLDCDGDGRLDIFLIQNGGGGSGSPNRLFRQRPEGRFEDATAGSGLGVTGRGMGAAVGDVDNDGRSDLLLTEYGGARLFLNRGEGKFAEATREAGIDNPFWGASAAFLDYDRDGFLDLVIANYVVFSPTRPCADQGGRRDYCGPQPFPGTVAKLFRNAGRGGRFEDATVRSGLGALPGPGLGVVCADFDGDRWPDILVANDGKANHLWVNQRDGSFKEEALFRGLALNGMGQAQANMGIALGDADGDGLFDIYVTHLTEELHVFWKQEPRGLFTDRTAAAGLASPRWRSTGFGALLADFDLDGALDLVQANGRVKFTSGPSPPGADFFEVYRERNQLFRGDGRGKFRDHSPTNGALCGSPGVWRGLAMGDLDGDGAPDLLVTQVAGRARLLRNRAGGRGRWLLARAIDPALGGRDAYGAEIALLAGGRRRVGWVNPGQSYLTSSDPRVHFGLGPVGRIDRLEVLWPDGSEESFPPPEVDRAVVLRKGEGKTAGGAPPR